ncbi:MAG: glycosyltransferase family 39 protein, partial [Pseudoflavonifractor sp.]
MLPLLYLFIKNLFGKTNLALCGTALFAFDFMHLTQTRIATIDTYGVFFILAMYYFMYRYLSLPAGSSFRAGALPLALSGLMWGLGAASKWTVIYGAAGLAVLYFLGLFFKWRDWPREENAPAFAPWLV